MVDEETYAEQIRALRARERLGDYTAAPSRMAQKKITEAMEPGREYTATDIANRARMKIGAVAPLLGRLRRHGIVSREEHEYGEDRYVIFKLVAGRAALEGRG